METVEVNVKKEEAAKEDQEMADNYMMEVQ